MKLCRSSQMRELDDYAINHVGIPSTLLMTNAANHIAKAAITQNPNCGPVAVFCGTGNNGGDGIAAAVFLKKHFIPVRAFLTGNRDKMTPDTLEMERRFSEVGGVVEVFDPASQDICDFVNGSAVIIDALFGIGLNADLCGDALSAVEMINNASAFVISADIPSGVEADTGKILGHSVVADLTVTFTLPKPGLFVEPGCTRCGQIVIADIGIPEQYIRDIETDYFVVMGDDISLPKRRLDTHKGDYGRDLLIAGSVGYTGAPILAARAAVRSGAGLVFLGIPENIYGIAAEKCDETMPFPLPCDQNGIISSQAVDFILEKLKNADVCLLGPGLGRSPEIEKVVRHLIKNIKIPLILDADGINALSGHIDILDEATCPLILTPHEGEFQRLGGNLSDGDRLRAASDFANRYHCILVLKGHRTITAFPDKTAYVNTTGGPGMAKGGSGDVLSGIIASFVGQKFPIKDAVLAAVYFHGSAGDRCAETIGEYAMTASDIIHMLPNVLKSR